VARAQQGDTKDKDGGVEKKVSVMLEGVVR
jgi:hypothetical protein